MKKFEHFGKVTAGYYNDMEAGHPFFVDGEPLSELVKDWLQENGLDPDVCYGPFEGPEHVNNPLVGCRVRISVEFLDEAHLTTACSRRLKSAAADANRWADCSTER